MLTDVLYSIVAFETFDVIAGRSRRFDEIAPVVRRLAFAALGRA